MVTTFPFRMTRSAGAAARLNGSNIAGPYFATIFAMKLAALILVALSFLAAEPLTPEKALRVRDLSELRYSPDAKRVAFTVREAPNGRSNQHHVWVYDTIRAEARQWTFSAKSEH